MEIKMALLALASLVTAAPMAQALDFGQTTFELEEKFEAPRGQHEFYKGETLSLSKPVRLAGLFPFEKQTIAMALGLDPQLEVREEQMLEFSQTDGYLTYFAHEPTGRQFIQVGHYPGDNEYGAIVEIQVSPSGTEVLGVVSRIEDGALVRDR